MPTARAGRRSVEATPTRFVAGHLFLLRPALLMLFAVGAAGWAMPPLPGPDGRPKARITWPARVESPQAVRPPSDQPGKVLVLAVDFSDDPHTFEQAELQSVLFDSGRGSMSDYYLEASHGSLTLSGIVAGWYRLSQSYSYYLGDSFGVFGQFPRNSQGLVADLVARADPDVDFSQYDADRDGFVDGLLLVHAGPGAEETGNPQDIWSHEWQMSDPAMGSTGPVATNDGVSVDVFSVQPERFESGGIISVGVFCHEFGHILGLPDLYDTDYSSSGLGWFSLMAAGSWARASETEPPGSSPVHPDAWCKYLLGWVSPDSVEQGVTDSVPDARIPAAASAAAAYRILPNPDGPAWSTESPGRGEYFLVENRQRIGFDQGLPGAGLLVLHVDESRPGNQDERGPLVGILRADGSPDFALPAGNWGSGAQLWKDSDTGVANHTVPSTAFYDGVQTGVRVSRISGPDSVMFASLEIVPLFLGKVYSYPNPVVVLTRQEKATIVYEPTDPVRLAGRFPAFKVRIYNLAGEPVRVLDEAGTEINPEHRAAFWDLANEQGRPATTGMYFYTIEIEESGVLEQNKGRLTIVR